MGTQPRPHEVELVGVDGVRAKSAARICLFWAKGLRNFAQTLGRLRAGFLEPGPGAALSRESRTEDDVAQDRVTV